MVPAGEDAVAAQPRAMSRQRFSSVRRDSSPPIEYLPTAGIFGTSSWVARTILRIPDFERQTMDRLLTADEIAERLGMKTEWVCAEARAGRIPHVRLGRYRRFRESAVDAWLQDLETGGSGRPATPQPRPIRFRRRA